MLTTKIRMYLSVVTLGAVAFSFLTLPLKAQTDTSESFSFEQIGVDEEVEFDFVSESETTSVRDDIKELEEYSISESNDFDGKLIEENKELGNRGAQSRYKLQTDVYNY